MTISTFIHSKTMRTCGAKGGQRDRELREFTIGDEPVGYSGEPPF